jgi:hypothetical protein
MCVPNEENMHRQQGRGVTGSWVFWHVHTSMLSR